MFDLNRTTLDRLDPGESGVIVCMRLGRRFMDMGLTEGTEIECVLESPLGATAAYLVRGTVTALRRNDAKCIDIERK